jgi:hypothetical protein
MDNWWVVYFENDKEVGRANFAAKGLAQSAADTWREAAPQKRSTQVGQGDAPSAELYLTQGG